jgi:hypothetical protein
VLFCIGILEFRIWYLFLVSIKRAAVGANQPMTYYHLNNYYAVLGVNRNATKV